MIPRIADSDYDSYFHIEQRAVPSPSYDAMATFSDDWTRPRINAILLGDYNNGKKNQGGYGSKVQEQDSGPQVWFEWDSTNISSTISEQLVPGIMKYGPESICNLPVSCYPLFKFEAAPVKDVMSEVGVAKQLSTLVPLLKTEIYSRTGYTIPQEGDDTIGGFVDPALGGDGQNQPESLIGSPGKVNYKGEMK